MGLAFDGEGELAGAGDDGVDYVRALGMAALLDAAVDVVFEAHEEVGTDVVIGADVEDEGVGVGRFLASDDGDVPAADEVFGQAAELDDGEFEGELAAEGVNAGPDTV